MNSMTAKELKEAGYHLVSNLNSQGLFLADGAKVISHRGREYALINETILRLTPFEWAKKKRYPKIGEQADASGRFILEQTEVVLSKTDWSSNGRKLANGARAVATITIYGYGTRFHVPLFREEDTVQRKLH